MTLALYGHPFASFVWKPLIALYERGISFTFKMVDPDHPENRARIAALSPTGQFPALTDGEREITQSNAVIEYLDLFHGNGMPMIPEDPPQALEARMMAEVLDDHVHVQTQRIVGDALRKIEERDPRGVADAHAQIERCDAWLELRLQARDGLLAAALRLPTAPPPRRFSTETGSIQLPSVTPFLRHTERGSCPAPRWHGSSMKRALIAAFFRWEHLTEISSNKPRKNAGTTGLRSNLQVAHCSASPI